MTRRGKRGKLKRRVSHSFHRAWKSGKKRRIPTFPQRLRRLLPRHNFQDTPLDKGYHSNEVLAELADWKVRSYCSEPERGRRRWEGKQEEQAAVYGNRRRIRGERGKRLLRQRGEKLERSFAHLYETGGMRRVHLRRHPNILKRLLVHVAAFNLGLVMRRLLGRGTPRGLQGWRLDLLLALLRLLSEVWARKMASEEPDNRFEPNLGLSESSNHTCLAIAKKAVSATGC